MGDDDAVHIANGTFFGPSDVPFGGYEPSCVGCEMGVLGFEEYLQAKRLAEPA